MAVTLELFFVTREGAPMKCFPYVPSVVVAAVITAGCGTHHPPESPAQPAAPIQAVETASTAGEKASLFALKDLGANVALEEEGRAKVVRLTGPEITDAELKHVGALTNLRALYLERTKVTDAGMAHLKPLTKLETLHCVTINGPRDLRVREELKANTHLECIEAPLSDILDNLGMMHDITFKIDEDALEAAGVPPDTPITAKQVNVPLCKALASVLEPLELEATLGDAALIVTTKEAFATERPHLAELREAAPGLKNVLVDW
jgi:hypothetical protein